MTIRVSFVLRKHHILNQEKNQDKNINWVTG